MIVNENYIKEYEEMSLCDFADELVEPLCIIKKDLTKATIVMEGGYKPRFIIEGTAEFDFQGENVEVINDCKK